MCIWIINYQAGEIVHQPIIQLFGFDSFYHETILVNNTYQWPIVQGLFKIYIQLESGENRIQLSTFISQLTFTLIYSPLKSNNIIFRLVYLSLSDQIDHNIEHICKQFLFLTKLIRSTCDEILYKQIGDKRLLLFDIEKQIHHVSMLKKDFEDKINDQDIFKEIYRQIYSTDLNQDLSFKLIINSSISSSLTFASTFKNIIVLNLPKEFIHLPASFDEFYETLKTIKAESLFYTIGAYLHELGHLFGLDHGNNQQESLMSSSKNFIDSGKDFFLITSRICSIISNRQCSCYKEPLLNLSCSYAHGLLIKQSIHLKSSCKSDIHCQFLVKFNHEKYNNKPHQCQCNGQFQFQIDHCLKLMEQFEK